MTSPRETAAAGLEVVRVALANAGRPVKTTRVASGAAVSWDDCCEGTAYVSVIRRYMSLRFPLESFEWTPCCSYQAQTAVEMVFGVLRCVPTAGATPTSPTPTPAAERAAALSLYDDMDTIWMALATWVCDWEVPALITGQVVVGPDGGCVGVETRMVFAEP